jgi:hypothetical protein
MAVLGLAITAALAAGCASSAPSPQASGSSSTTPLGTVSATGGTTPSAAGTTASAGHTPTVPAGTPRCHTRDVSGSFTYVVGSGEPGSGSYNIELTNKSTHTCTVRGYPGLLLLDINRQPLPTNVIWDPQNVKPLITLRPGASASANAHIWHVATTGDNMPTSTMGPQDCQPTSEYIEITPPDETTQLVVPVQPPTPVCGRGTMHVSAFVPGTQALGHF